MIGSGSTVPHAMTVPRLHESREAGCIGRAGSPGCLLNQGAMDPYQRVFVGTRAVVGLPHNALVG